MLMANEQHVITELYIVKIVSKLPVALMGQDLGLDQGFIADSMKHVGFKSVSSHTIDMPMGPMDIDIARKK